MASAIETITQVYVRTLPIAEEQYQRSLFRRAWDMIESMLVLVQNKTRYYNEDEDEDEAEFQNPLNPHRRNIHREGSIKSRISTDSDSTQSSSSASSVHRYDPWQEHIDGELAQMKVSQKDLISRWAKGEVGPWFDWVLPPPVERFF